VLGILPNTQSPCHLVEENGTRMGDWQMLTLSWTGELPGLIRRFCP
jgi:hypothetical protein